MRLLILFEWESLLDIWIHTVIQYGFTHLDRVKEIVISAKEFSFQLIFSHLRLLSWRSNSCLCVIILLQRRRRILRLWEQLRRFIFLPLRRFVFKCIEWNYLICTRSVGRILFFYRSQLVLFKHCLYFTLHQVLFLKLRISDNIEIHFIYYPLYIKQK